MVVLQETLDLLTEDLVEELEVIDFQMEQLVVVIQLHQVH